MFKENRKNVNSLLIFFVIVVSTNIHIASSHSLSSSYKKVISKDNARQKWRMGKTRWLNDHQSTKFSRHLTEEEEDIPIDEREGPLKSTINGAVKLPMYSGAEYKMGEYVVDVEFGTPPRKLRMVADTGSDLTWVKCKHGDRGRHFGEHAFDTSKSSTFKSFTCGSILCQEDFKLLNSIDMCPTFDAPCFYNYSYGEGDFATFGHFAKDSITLATTTGKSVTLHNMLVGCTESVTGKENIDWVDGILGLGMHPFSFAIHAVSKFGGTFSYCLVDHLSQHNVTNYLIFGDQKEKSPTQEFMRYTRLHVNEESAFYWVYIKGVTLGSNMLDINEGAWDNKFEEGGGTILDSGTSATFWLESAYRVIMDALISTLSKEFPKLKGWVGDGINDFEYCFNANATQFKKFKVPRLEIHFKDGARFKPHVKSYIIDDAPNVKCIGFLQAHGGVNVIGNILQQNYLWEFDVHHETMGFVPSTCE